ncbi:MAG: phosphatidate cytidylyltransferase, partial [Clostridiales bacterium]|nr:phosphatidate cytidylyltransferase [Clostridiales bacterium]
MQRIITGAILIALLIFVIAVGGWFFALIATAALCIA